MTPPQAVAKVPTIPASIGRYTVTGALEGTNTTDAYAALYRGVEAFERPVTIRALKPSLASDVNQARLFIDEMSRVALLCHGAIERVYDIGEHEGVPFVATERVSGCSLHRVLQSCDDQNVSMPVAIALRIAGEALTAFSYAHNHARGAITHGALSAKSLFVTDNGDVKLSWFQPETPFARHAAPEHDIRALVRVVYACLVGRVPSDERSGEPYLPLRHAAPSVPPDLARLVDEMLHPERALDAALMMPSATQLYERFADVVHALDFTVNSNDVLKWVEALLSGTLSDERHVVRQRAMAVAAQRGASANTLFATLTRIQPLQSREPQQARSAHQGSTASAATTFSNGHTHAVEQRDAIEQHLLCGECESPAMVPMHIAYARLCLATANDDQQHAHNATTTVPHQMSHLLKQGVNLAYAWALDAEFDELLCIGAMLHAEHGRPNQAAAWLKRVTERPAQSAEAAWLRNATEAHACIAAGHWRSALPRLELVCKTQRLHPARFIAQLNLALTYAALGRAVSADEAFEQVDRHFEHHPPLGDNHMRAWVNERKLHAALLRNDVQHMQHIDVLKNRVLRHAEDEQLHARRMLTHFRLAIAAMHHQEERMANVHLSCCVQTAEEQGAVLFATAARAMQRVLGGCTHSERALGSVASVIENAAACRYGELERAARLVLARAYETNNQADALRTVCRAGLREARRSGDRRSGVWFRDQLRRHSERAQPRTVSSTVVCTSAEQQQASASLPER